MITGKYNKEKTINFSLMNIDGLNLEVGAVFATGDVKIMLDEGTEANTTNLPVDEGQGYSLVLTDTEMSSARVTLYIIDSATKVWIDKSINIETYGNSLAEHAFDLDSAAVSTIATGSSAISTVPISQVLTVGTEVNDYTDTETKNGVYHEITDVAGALDMYYTFDVGVEGVASEISMWGHLTGSNDTIGIYAYNWDGASWDQIGSMTGSNSTEDVFISFNLLERHTGTSTNEGKVRIRGYAVSGLTSATLYLDQTYVSYAIIPITTQKLGTVSDATPLVSGFDTDLTEADGIFNETILTFSTGVLTGESRIVSTQLNLNGALTFSADFSATPADGDKFHILHTHIHSVIEIQTGLATEAKQDIIDTVVDTIKAETALIVADTNELQTDDIPTLIANLDTLIDTVKAETVLILSDTNAVLIDTAVIGAAGAGLTALASQASLNVVDGIVDAIKVKTDPMTYTKANELDSNVQSINEINITGDGNTTPFDVV